MSSVTMWKARFIAEDGTEHDVQVPGMELGKGAAYYSEQFHKGRLCCAYCDAGVHYNGGSPSILGSSSNGRPPHFVTNGGASHENCLWPLRKSFGAESAIDPEKGYRIHVNTQSYSELFNEPAGAYHKGKIADARLRGMEMLSVHSAQDFVTLLQKGEYDRINKSVAIFRNKVIEWDKFCIHQGKMARYFELLERLQARAKDEPLPFCLIELTTEKRHSFRGYGRQRVPMKDIVMAERDGQGRTQRISPAVYIRNRDNMIVMDAFGGREGSYFVLGQVQYKKNALDKVVFHNLNITVIHAQQVVPVNTAEIAEKGRKHTKRRVLPSENGPSL
ncbi:MAG: hypothetical protein WC989_00200 [Micavibrio sp.]